MNLIGDKFIKAYFKIIDPIGGWLVGAGMFFDGYDLYVAGGVLAATIHTHFSTLHQNLQFLSLTFVGMTLGALITGFLGDRYGRRFTYQINLLVFGLASLAAAFAANIDQLIVPSPHGNRAGIMGSLYLGQKALEKKTEGSSPSKSKTVDPVTDVVDDVRRCGLVRVAGDEALTAELSGNKFSF